jgi:hypothetical protein
MSWQDTYLNDKTTWINGQHLQEEYGTAKCDAFHVSAYIN